MPRPPRRPARTPAYDAVVVARLEAGEHYKLIAAELGIAPSTVHRIRREVRRG